MSVTYIESVPDVVGRTAEGIYERHSSVWTLCLVALDQQLDDVEPSHRRQNGWTASEEIAETTAGARSAEEGRRLGCG